MVLFKYYQFLKRLYYICCFIRWLETLEASLTICPRTLQLCSVTEPPISQSEDNLGLLLSHGDVGCWIWRLFLSDGFGRSSSVEKISAEGEHISYITFIWQLTAIEAPGWCWSWRLPLRKHAFGLHRPPSLTVNTEGRVTVSIEPFTLFTSIFNKGPPEKVS